MIFSGVIACPPPAGQNQLSPLVLSFFLVQNSLNHVLHVLNVPIQCFARVTGQDLPWDILPWEPAIHLVLFVHRVNGVAPGLYMLALDPAKVDSLRRAMHRQFAWTLPPGCPENLPLFLLEEGDARQLAAQVSCRQEIAGDSAFSLGMIAEFEPTSDVYVDTCRGE
jgi:hypothetical protein